MKKNERRKSYINLFLEFSEVKFMLFLTWKDLKWTKSGNNSIIFMKTIKFTKNTENLGFFFKNLFIILSWGGEFQKYDVFRADKLFADRDWQYPTVNIVSFLSVVC